MVPDLIYIDFRFEPEILYRRIRAQSQCRVWTVVCPNLNDIFRLSL